MRAVVAGLALAICFAACAPDEAVRQGALSFRFALGALPEIEIWVAAALRKVQLAEHHRIRIATSDRAAVLTLSGVT